MDAAGRKNLNQLPMCQNANVPMTTKAAIGLVLLVSCLLFSSCVRTIQGCTDPDAINYDAEARVNNGFCYYERGVLIGDWAATDTCTIGGQQSVSQYNIIIEEHPDSSNRVNILNIFGCGSETTAIISNGDLWLEFKQDACQGADLYGSGSFTDSTIFLDYVADPGLNAGTCLLNAVKL